LIDGRFAVEAWAGAGGMGTVYRGRDRRDNATVAIKVLGAQELAAVERFSREAALLAELRHEGIVRYVAHGRTSDGAYYLAMEWLDGEPLADRMRGAGLTLVESLALAKAAATALGEAHARGVVHRDVNPRNLFLPRGASADKVKLLDFGIARLSSHELERTGVGTILGTPGYMAPEQARGERDVGPAADVFSLGCVLFECLTGRPPFAGEKAMAVLAKILLEEAPRVAELAPGTPPAIDALVARMLAKSPKARPSDGKALAELFDAIDVRETEPGRAVPARPSASLGDVEQRLLCVIFADGGADKIDRLLPVTAPFGGALDRLAGGAVVWSLASGGVAGDQAQRAANCALAFREALPEAAIAMATGRGMLSSEGSAGEVIDRAARLIDGSRGKEIRLDDTTAGLLGNTFDVGGDSRGLVLRGTREVVEPVRTLLGRATPCVGRDRELQGLEALFDECVDEPVAKVALVTAPAGGGKSRVRHELIRRLRARDTNVEIWLGRGDPMRVGSPFGILGPAIRRALNIRDGEPQPVREHKLRARITRLFTDETQRERVAAFVGELVGVHFSDDALPQLRAARRDPVLMNDQMRQAWEDWLAAESRAQPVLLVLEDLHWGDLPTVRFIDSALRNLRDSPIMVLALARPDVHDLFPKLWHERNVWEIKLAPLGKKAAQQLVRAVLGDVVPQEKMDALVAQAEGNPLYLEELVRTVAEQPGGLSNNDQALPETVLAMVQARLERLETDARRVLRAASVFGQVFWRGGIRALLGRQDRTNDVGDWLDELVAREMIQKRIDSRFPGEEEFVFRNALTREAAYAMLTVEDRKLGHRLAGDWLVEEGEEDGAVLANHFERGGDQVRAVSWYRAAAEDAFEGEDLEVVLERCDRGIACGAAGPELGALRLLQAEVLSWRGARADANLRALEATQLVVHGSQPWYAAAANAISNSSRTGDFDMVVQLADALPPLDLSRDVFPPQVVTQARAVADLLQIGQGELARKLLLPLDQLRRDKPDLDPEVMAWIETALAWQALFDGDTGESLKFDEAAARSFERAGDVRNACKAWAGAGYERILLGQYDQAETALRDALASAERMGLSSLAVNAKHNLGLALARLGRLDEAVKVERDAAEAYAAQQDAKMIGASRHYLALILRERDELDAAEREALMSLEALRGFPPLMPRAFATLAAIHLGQGKVAEALAEADEAMGMMEAQGGIEDGEALIRLIHAEALAAGGDASAARSAIAVARERVEKVAQKISDATLCESFRERVPENARIIKLADEWK
jgi:eukaryotic-like serine/threonine-protein kinase